MYWHSKSAFDIYNIFIYSNIGHAVFGSFQTAIFEPEVFDRSRLSSTKSVLLQAVSQNSHLVGKFKTLTLRAS